MDRIMEYIYTVYKTGSFSAASKELFITQPALSIAIRKTEENLGTLLFDRSKHPLQLTMAGEIYMRKICQIRELEEDLNREIHDLNILKTGKLRIGGTQYFNSFILPPVLSRFCNVYPGVQVEIREASSNNIADYLVDGRVDVMFNAADFNPEDFEQTPAFVDTILLAVPKSHVINDELACYGMNHQQVCEKFFLHNDFPAVPMEMFAETSLILLSPGNNLHSRSLEFCKEAGFEPKVTMMLDQLVTSYHLARAGLGAVFVSDLLVAENIPMDMVYYKLPYTHATRLFKAVTKRRRYITRVTAEFIRLCREYYQVP